MLCEKCRNAVFCDSWGQFKCTHLQVRLYGAFLSEECKYFAEGEPEKECRCKTCEEQRSNEDE